MIDLMLGSLGNFAPLGVLVLRNGYGWLANSLKDGKIQQYEIKQGLLTLLKLGSLAVFLHLGFDLSGIDSAALASVADAVRSDLLKPALGKK